MSQAREPGCMTDMLKAGLGDQRHGPRAWHAARAMFLRRVAPAHRLFSLGQPHADGNTGTGSAPSALRGTSGGRSYWPRVTPVTASALACLVEGADPAGTRRGPTPCPLLLSLHRPGPSPVTVPTRGPGRLFPRTEGSCCRRPPDHRFVTRCHTTVLSEASEGVSSHRVPLRELCCSRVSRECVRGLSGALSSMGERSQGSRVRTPQPKFSPGTCNLLSVLREIWPLCRYLTKSLPLNVFW